MAPGLRAGAQGSRDRRRGDATPGERRDPEGGAYAGEEVAREARQKRVRALYLAQARILMTSPFASDQALGRAVEAFVQGMPAPDSQRLALARQLRAANEQARQ